MSSLREHTLNKAHVHVANRIAVTSFGGNEDPIRGSSLVDSVARL